MMNIRRRSAAILAAAVVLSLPSPCAAKDGWQGEVRLTDDPGISMPPPNNGKWIAVDQEGRIHVVFKDDRDRDFEIYHKIRSGGVWLPEQRVYDSGGDSARPVLAVDGLGRVHLVWNDLQDGNKEIYHAIWNGSWSAPQRVTFTPGPSFASSVVAVGNKIHLVHMDEVDGVSQILYRSYDVLSWSDPVQLSDAADGERLLPSITAGPDGDLYAVWWDAPPGGGYGSIVMRSCLGGVWSDPDTVTEPEAEAYRPNLAVDDTGAVHVVWIDHRSEWEQIYYRRRSAGEWGPETQVTSGDYTHYHPSIVCAGGTVSMIYWANYPSTQTAGVFARTLEGDLWSERVRISSSSSYASLTCLVGEADGRLHAGWADARNGAFDIYYNEYLPPGNGIADGGDGQDPGIPSPPLSLAVAPNPFTSRARITLTTGAQGRVAIGVYDVAGRLVRRIASGELPGGLYRFEWDGRDDAGRSAPPGVYFARARAGKLTLTTKMVMMR